MLSVKIQIKPEQHLGVSAIGHAPIEFEVDMERPGLAKMKFKDQVYLVPISDLVAAANALQTVMPSLATE